jgi:hypothetical protein
MILRKHISRLMMSAVTVLIFAGAVCAQTEADLKQYFEGKRVELKIDMPATKDGITIYPEKYQHLNFNDYSKRLKQFGIAVREGDRIMITKIKVKDKLIEFQLGGGGYGTFGDETSSTVSVPTITKSNREKDFEKRLKDETDERKRRRIRDELDYLRREREDEDRRNRAEAAVAEEIAKARIQDKRLQGGSRFNIKFDRKLTSNDLTPEALVNALREYVYFPDMR